MHKLTKQLLGTLLLSLAFSGGYAQFTSKTEFSLQGGFTIANDKFLTMPDGSSVNLGDIAIPVYYFNFWVNLDRNLSVGVNVGVFSYSVFNETYGYNGYYNTLQSEITHDAAGGSIGVSARYYLLNRKKFKAYAKGGFSFNGTDYSYATPIIVLEGNQAPFEEKLYFTENEYQGETVTGIGGNFAVGMKTYFSNSFGMMFEAGYNHLSYHKGPTAGLGFFLDAGRK